MLNNLLGFNPTSSWTLGAADHVIDTRQRERSQMQIGTNFNVYKTRGKVRAHVQVYNVLWINLTDFVDLLIFHPVPP